ncbi:hypothetical protein J6590_048635 [Homalodisca vitripennis]|nr:hypothetical protein J6590_048635 [Homalodisca vitripennis]
MRHVGEFHAVASENFNNEVRRFVVVFARSMRERNVLPMDALGPVPSACACLNPILCEDDNQYLTILIEVVLKIFRTFQVSTTFLSKVIADEQTDGSTVFEL